MTCPDQHRSSAPWILAALLLGCGDSGGSVGSVPPGTSFEPAVTHPFFPIESGVIRTYRGDHEGQVRQEVVRTIEQWGEIDGVSCGAVLQDVFVGGDLAEVTTEWYAQDTDGNVWKFGEESFEVIEGVPVLDEDSWVAGEGEIAPWIAFPAKIRVGDVFYGYSPTTVDEFRVSSLTAVASVPAGIFTDCLTILENAEDPEDGDIILYSAGVGRVFERNVVTGPTDLIRVEGR